MRILILAACACTLAACGIIGSSDDMTPASTPTPTASTSTSSGSWFWPFGGSDTETATDMPQLGVNAYLWRATLDTLNFMPLLPAAPVAGVLISDWYGAPDKPAEHRKGTFYFSTAGFAPTLSR